MLICFRYLGSMCLGKFGCFWLRFIVMMLKLIGVCLCRCSSMLSIV